MSLKSGLELDAASSLLTHMANPPLLWVARQSLVAIDRVPDISNFVQTTNTRSGHVCYELLAQLKFLAIFFS